MRRRDLVAAAGLAKYDQAARDPNDLGLAKQSIWAAVRAYDDPGYTDTHTTQYTAVKLPQTGVRSQGPSMVLVWLLSALLEVHEDAHLEQLQREHVELVISKFWNPEYGIANEYLRTKDRITRRNALADPSTKSKPCGPTARSSSPA